MAGLLGTATWGGKPDWTLAGVGAGLIVISIPFTAAYNKHAKNAVKIYNAGLKQTVFNNLNFEFGTTGNGICMRMTF